MGYENTYREHLKGQFGVIDLTARIVQCYYLSIKTRRGHPE
ncbi:MAG: hypothetical protein AB8Z15_02070 [Coxiella endosymbiont of Haemaphysalis japonica]